MRVTRSSLDRLNTFLIQLNETIMIFNDDTGMYIEVPSNCINNANKGSVSTLVIDEEAYECKPFVKILDIVQGIKAKPNIVDVKELTPREYMKIVGASVFSELILETTTVCNMRCRYCLYSGEYYGFRTHGVEKKCQRR